MELGHIFQHIIAQNTDINIHQGVIKAINTSTPIHTVTLTLAGGTNEISNVRYIHSYMPRVNDVVWVLLNRKDPIVLGTLAGVNELGTTKTISPKAYRTSDLAIGVDVGTIVPMQAVEGDPWGCWSPTNPSRLTAPIAGRYIAHTQTLWSDGATAYRYARIKLNGTTEIAYSDTVKQSGHGSHNNISTAPFTMQAGDYVELSVKAGAALSLLVTLDGENYTGWMNTLSLIYLGS